MIITWKLFQRHLIIQQQSTIFIKYVLYTATFTTVTYNEMVWFPKKTLKHEGAMFHNTTYSLTHGGKRWEDISPIHHGSPILKKKTQQTNRNFFFQSFHCNSVHRQPFQVHSRINSRYDWSKKKLVPVTLHEQAETIK